jgi:hypothetical protein
MFVQVAFMACRVTKFSVRLTDLAPSKNDRTQTSSAVAAAAAGFKASGYSWLLR